MSYALSAAECPPGFVPGIAADGSPACVGGDTCPPGFAQIDKACVPSVDTACQSIGKFYDPREPDRCKSKCPVDTTADTFGVCRVVPGAVAAPAKPNYVIPIVAATLAAVTATIVAAAISRSRS